MSVKYQPSGRLVAVKNWPGVGRHACMHIDQVSVGILADYRSPYGPRVSVDTQPTDALSTHDPNYESHPDKFTSYRNPLRGKL